MSTYTFDREVRPYLREIPIAKQGVAFELVELDAWADHHSEANGRLAQKEDLWQSECPASTNGATTGGLTSESKITAEWRRARERVT